jgi:hypothetical protein
LSTVTWQKQLDAIEIDSLFDAERTANQRAAGSAVEHVVVETRDEQDGPGIEATFVVCPASNASLVPQAREIVYRTTHPEVAAVREHVDSALILVGKARALVSSQDDPSLLDLLAQAEKHLELALPAPLRTAGTDD